MRGCPPRRLRGRGQCLQRDSRGPGSPPLRGPRHRWTGPGTLLFCSRKRIEELSSELCETLRNLEKSDKERKQLESKVAAQDLKRNELLDLVQVVQHQVWRAGGSQSPQFQLAGSARPYREGTTINPGTNLPEFALECQSMREAPNPRSREAPSRAELRNEPKGGGRE